jgi:DNA-binding transcriptional ArsR family regulator
MKSQDIVVLLKLISLHAEFFEESLVTSDLILTNDSFEDWTDDGLSSLEIGRLGISREYFESRFSVRSLAADTGISKSQISLSLKRMYDVGLAKNDRRLGIPKTNSKALLEFIAYGIRYVFPAKEGELTRGIATSIAAPVLQGKLMTSGELSPVWPYAKGKTKGLTVEPLHPNIFQSVREDGRMYAFLALTDAVRLGKPRERNVAIDTLATLFNQNI